jgi:hypothetical protein
MKKGRNFEGRGLLVQRSKTSVGTPPRAQAARVEGLA